MKLNSVKDIIDNISVIENVGCGDGADDGINQLMVKSLVEDFGIGKETAREFCKSESGSDNEIIVDKDKHIYCLTVYWTATDIKYDLTRGKFVAMMRCDKVI